MYVVNLIVVIVWGIRLGQTQNASGSNDSFTDDRVDLIKRNSLPVSDGQDHERGVNIHVVGVMLGLLVACIVLTVWMAKRGTGVTTSNQESPLGELSDQFDGFGEITGLNDRPMLANDTENLSLKRTSSSRALPADELDNSSASSRINEDDNMSRFLTKKAVRFVDGTFRLENMRELELDRYPTRRELAMMSLYDGNQDSDSPSSSM